MGSVPGTHSSGRRNSHLERSVAPLVGVVLLIGLVLAGSMILTAMGFTLVDEIVSETDRQQAIHCLEEFDHRATTVSTGGGEKPLPCDEMRIVDDGELHIVWHNESVTDIPNDLGETYSNTTVAGDLGTVEFERGDRSIAYQGGGIWEQAADRTHAHSNSIAVTDSPGIGATILRLELVRIAGSIDTNSASIRRDSERPLDSSIDDARSKALDLDYRNLTIVLESEYHEGWQSHFSAAIEDGIVSTTDLAIEDVDEDRAVQVDLVDVIQPTSDPVNRGAGHTVGVTGEVRSLAPSDSEQTDAPESVVDQRAVTAASPGTLVDIHVHEIVLE